MMFKSSNRTDYRTYKINIGSNARLDELGWSGELDAINKLKGAGRSIVINFELDNEDNIVNVSAKLDC